MGSEKSQWKGIVLSLDGTVDGPEIRRSPVEVGSLSHYLQVFFIHRTECRISSINRGCRISSINSMFSWGELFVFRGD